MNRIPSCGYTGKNGSRETTGRQFVGSTICFAIFRLTQYDFNFEKLWKAHAVGTGVGNLLCAEPDSV